MIPDVTAALLRIRELEAEREALILRLRDEQSDRVAAQAAQAAAQAERDALRKGAALLVGRWSKRMAELAPWVTLERLNEIMRCSDELEELLESTRRSG